jgi:hypothetical protein
VLFAAKKYARCAYGTDILVLIKKEDVLDLGPLERNKDAGYHKKDYP